MSLTKEPKRRPMESSGSVLTNYRNRFVFSSALLELLENENEQPQDLAGSVQVYVAEGGTIAEAIAELGGKEKLIPLPSCAVGRIASMGKWYGKSGFLGKGPVITFLRHKGSVLPIVLELHQTGNVFADVAHEEMQIPPGSWIIAEPVLK